MSSTDRPDPRIEIPIPPVMKTPYPGIIRAHTVRREHVAHLLLETGAWPGIADPKLADSFGRRATLPTLPISERVESLAKAAGVSALSVLYATLHMVGNRFEERLPPEVRNVELPPTLLIGTPSQVDAALAAAERAIDTIPNAGP